MKCKSHADEKAASKWLQNTESGQYVIKKTITWKERKERQKLNFVNNHSKSMLVVLDKQHSSRMLLIIIQPYRILYIILNQCTTLVFTSHNCCARHCLSKRKRGACLYPRNLDVELINLDMKFLYQCHSNVSHLI